MTGGEGSFSVASSASAPPTLFLAVGGDAALTVVGQVGLAAPAVTAVTTAASAASEHNASLSLDSALYDLKRRKILIE